MVLSLFQCGFRSILARENSMSHSNLGQPMRDSQGNNVLASLGKHSVLASSQHATFHSCRTIDDHEKEMIVLLGESALSDSIPVSNVNHSRSNTEGTMGASSIQGGRTSFSAMSGRSIQAKWNAIYERHRRDIWNAIYERHRRDDLARSNVGTAITQRPHAERSFGRDGSLSGRAAHSEMVDQTSQPVANAIHSRSKIGTLRRITVDSGLRSNHEVSFGMECTKNDMESHSKMVDTTSRAVGNAIGNITRFENKNQLLSYSAVDKQSSQPVGIAIHPRSITAGSSRSACSLSGRASHREMVDHTS